MLKPEVRGRDQPPLPTSNRVEARWGIDLHPIDVRDEVEGRWLRALVYPEHTDRLEVLRGLAAASDLVTSLEETHRFHTMGETEHAFVASLLEEHSAYLESMDALFAAVDAGDHQLVEEIHENQIDPVFHGIEEGVGAAAATHRATAERALAGC